MFVCICMVWCYGCMSLPRHWGRKGMAGLRAGVCIALPSVGYVAATKSRLYIFAADAAMFESQPHSSMTVSSHVLVSEGVVSPLQRTGPRGKQPCRLRR